jgi:integrase
MTAEPIRQRRRRLTDTMIAALPRQSKRYIKADPELLGHYLRVPERGPIVFTCQARDPYTHKQVWSTIGTTDELGVEEAREQARALRKRIAQGLPAKEPLPPKAESFAAIADRWVKRHIRANGIRTAANVERVLRVYALPHWADRDFASIKRRDIAALLDSVEGDEHKTAMADKVATVLRSLASWYVDQGYAPDDYTSPFTRLRQRTPKEKQKRARVLADDEIRAVWKAADEAGAFGGLIKLLLLTGARREKVLTLRRDDVSPDGVWRIRTEAREKPNAGALKLPEAALEIIKAQPRFVGSPFVFPYKAFNSRTKRTLEQKCGVSGWRVHDLRRTARTLLSKAGVRRDIAERVLGHAVGGIEATYDRHDFASAIADALNRLAALIEIILAGEPTDNVGELRKKIDGMVGEPSNVVPFPTAAAVS